jgi:hypothetical protein
VVYKSKKMKCLKCGKNAEYIYRGSSLCKKHKELYSGIDDLMYRVRLEAGFRRL